ncbi:DUF937 domain-containing protein [Xanthobacter autotrophicus DSM 431]|uniref:DUF937 domain-containing protein n=1 Tax=Xanthobacter nonsaccharivorans TaxID=3119912 RepID=UPI00372A55C0
MDQFVEMLRAAQGGQAIENIARMYGLSAQQAQMLTEAVMPAFAEAFKQASQSPEALASLMALMSSGPYGAFYTQPAVPPADLTRAGTEALDAVFGSSDVSRAIAAHAAASTGLGVALVRQTLPSLATLVVGGLAKSLAASGALQQMLAAMLSRMPGQTPALRAAPVSSGNPWIDAFLAFTSTAVETTPKPPSTGNPWADAYAQMMFQRAAPAPAPERNPAAAWQDVVNAMAKTMAQAGVPPIKTQAPEPPPPPLMPFQHFFAQLFAQGFPPAFPGAEGVRAPYSIPEFWMDMMKTASPRDVQEAETLPPEKPRLVKPQAESKGEAKPTNGKPASGR